ncbi:glycosyltransferase family 1 protein [Bacillus haynesii]|uniref:glycosyltransferase n=1 Tax=Bacillus haynesii TaxID=1925021 RepID=UPI0022828B40|nr:glycosyltransferase [Bacillus haynesii]MCY7969591.1 glycosyltransferase family 1 protein [Bacillus haynesii]MCY8400980.1 glycosyltransferase family 1 protein [Bacillus haynesii]MCY9213152.1 glycosyltransferase family 1 protein [Bacillus haynesii]MEC1579461.1 glycosyltransferase family 1 protein [Bacillus haynesii]
MKDFKSDIIQCLEQKDWNKAMKRLKEWEADGSHNEPDFYFLQASLSVYLGHDHNAWLWLWRGLDLFPDNRSLNLLMGKVCLRTGREKESAAYLQKGDGAETESALNLDLPADEKNDPPAGQIRVLQGTMEIANQMNTLAKGLTQQGALAHTLNYYPYYLKYAADYTWSLLKERNTPVMNARLRRLASDLLPSYDLFHFHFGTSFTLDMSDYPILKQAGKPMIMHHWGSDVRLYSILAKTNPYAVVKTKNEARIRYHLKRISQYVQHCIVADMELYEYVKNYYEHVHMIPTMIQLDRYTPDYRSNEKPLIVHAPTSPGIKGTRHILKAVESLKEKYDFHFHLVRGVSHEQAKKIYQKADLIIDQLHIGSYGLFAVESMAMGKPVICWISDFMKDHYPSELPLIRANPDNITEVIENVLKNRDMLPEIGQKGRKYAEVHHDMVKNSKKTLAVYQSLLSG